MILESTVGIGGMSLGDAGSWASLIGLVITLLTFFMTSRVNKKVNGILKQKKDRKFFEKKAPTVIQNLNVMLELAEEDDKKSNYWSATKQQTRINNAIEIVNSSWDILLPYENAIIRKIKIMSWNRKFKNVKEMYNGTTLMDSKKIVVFLTELVTFLEKEMENNE